MALLAPAVAAAGIAYAYGPGIDPAWELSQSMAVSDRMVLLVRALAVFGLNAALGLAASAASGAAAAVTFGWLVPMTAVCALALAAATLARSANVGVAAGLAGWAITVLSGAGPPAGSSPRRSPAPPWSCPTWLFAACCGAVALVRDPDPERNVMNVEITDLTRRFGRTQAVAGVSLRDRRRGVRAARPERRRQDLAAADDGHRAPADLGHAAAARPRPGAYAPRREIRRRLGYLPQNLGYYPGFTVAEFVEYFALLKEMPPAQVPRAVAAAIEQVGLGDKARAKLRTLSGGMLRRVGIAQAIVNEPELLLLDEPTAGLDPEQRVAFRALLRDLGQRATVIVSTHLVEDVGAACTEVALMDTGRIVFHGTPDELTARGEGSGAAGDAPLERGYSAVLAAADGQSTAGPGHDRHDRRPGAAPDPAPGARGPADRRPAAPDRAAPQPDAADPAADRRCCSGSTPTGPAPPSRRCGGCARSGTWARATPSSTSGRSWRAWPPGSDRGTAGAAWPT